MTASERRLKATSAEADILSDLFEIVTRRWSVLAMAFIVTTLVATVVALTKPPVYEASGTLIADKSPPVVLLTNAGRESSFVQQSLAQAPDAFTLTELVKSETVRDGTIGRLTPTFSPGRVKEILSKGMLVQQVRSTELVRVRVRYRDPRTAAAVANAAAESVVDMDLKARRRQATIARDFIGEQLEIAGRDLRTGHHALAAFKKESGDVSLSDETQLNLRKLADLEAELTDVRLEQQQAPSGFAQSLSAARAGTSQQVPNPLIAALQTQLASLEVENTGLRKQFTPLHPQVLSTQAKIDETRKRLNAEFERKQAALATRERSLSAEIEKLERVLMKVPSREAVLARLTLDSKEAERNYLLLSEKFQEARIAEGSIGSSVRIVDVAKPSTRPIGPQRRTNIVFGMVLGLLLGMAGAFVMEQLDETVKSAKDAERLLGAPVLGMAPLLPKHDGTTAQGDGALPALLTQYGPTSDVVESFRMLRTRMLQAMRDAEAKCLLISSATSGEGKTNIAVNLAIAVAQTDRHVWLIDCNLRSPALHRVFPEANSLGLSACLAGRTGIDDVARPTVHPRLACVVGGAAVQDPTGLLDSQLMTHLLDQARERADLVLLDGPAIHPVTDAEVVGLRADRVVLVVQIGKTDRLALVQAMQRLDALGIGVLGAVLNQSSEPSSRPFAWDAATFNRGFARLHARLRNPAEVLRFRRG